MKKTKINLRLIIGFALILMLALALIMSGTLAKDTNKIIIANEVDYTNQLADSFRLLDKPITVQEDGSYTVDTSSGAEPMSGFSYKLIPGVMLPASPYIEIVNKTVIPAYLYLEIDNSGAAELEMDGSWKLLDGVSGKKGGTVYSYGDEALVGEAQAGATEETTASGSQADDDVLTFTTFIVKTLSKIPSETEGSVKVYAYMIQKVGEQSAKDAFQAAPAP